MKLRGKGERNDPHPEYTRLAAALMLRAVKDAARGSGPQCAEARRFLLSQEAAGWCELAGMDPKPIRAWVKRGCDPEQVRRARRGKKQKIREPKPWIL